MNAPANIDFTVRKQTEAAKNLVLSLKDIGEDADAELVADTIEGETSLIEALELAVAEIDECDIQIVGVKEKIEQFAARKHQTERRRERLTALIEQALIATEQTTLKLPTATLTLANRAASVIISNEADIPAKFWKEQERPAPKLDKKAIKEALTNDEHVTGATLDNGSVSLTIRRK